MSKWVDSLTTLWVRTPRGFGFFYLSLFTWSHEHHKFPLFKKYNISKMSTVLYVMYNISIAVEPKNFLVIISVVY